MGLNFLGIQNIHAQDGNSNNLSAPINFNHLTGNEGLSQNSVISLAQDSLGYLWIATQDGLNRYDGNSMMLFQKQFDDVTRENYNILGKVYVDRKGLIWIITSRGQLELFDFDSATFKLIKTPAPINTILQLNDDSYVFGTLNNGFYFLKSGSSSSFAAKHYTLDNQTVYDFAEVENNIYIAAENAIYNLANDTLLQIPNKELGNNVFYSSLEKTENQLFIGTFGQGLFNLNSTDNVIERYIDLDSPGLLQTLNIQDLKYSDNEILWLGTYGDGAFRLDLNLKNFQQFTYNKYDDKSINYNDILCIYEDISGNIWLGTDGGGASFYDAYLNKFNGLTNRQVGSDVHVDVIRSIAVDDKGNMWLGTSGKGLTYISKDGNIKKTYNVSNSPLSTNRIMSLLYDEGKLYIGHQGGGLDVYSENENWQHFGPETTPKLEAETIWTIKKSNNGIWLGSRDHGLILFNETKGTLQKFQHQTNNPNSIVSNNIRSITEDKIGNLWIASTDQGLCSYNEDTRLFRSYNNIPKELKSLFMDEDRNTLWIGTNGNGLLGLDPNSGAITRSFTTKNGLVNNVVYSILEDINSNLWLSTNKGLTRFDVGTKTFNHYNQYDGLQGLEFNTGAYFKDRNGTLYFGGLDGVNWFQPQQIETNPNTPNTVLTDLQINGVSQEIVPNQEFAPTNNTLTFTFSALHFSQPIRNNYKYMLEGYDDDWTLSGFGNKAHYTKLPPGDYTFKVKSSNYDDVWSESLATFPFTISKPWYLTNWAFIGYSIVFILLIGLMITYFRWRWKIKMRLQEEHQQTIYFKELNDVKTKLYTNISHEIRTPLTLIKGPVLNQLNRSNLSAKDKQELELLNRNTERLLDLVNQMTDLSRIDSGQLKVKNSQGDLTSLIRQIIQAFSYKAKEKNISIKEKLELFPTCYFDVDIMEKIITNIVSNAIKHAPNNSVVNVAADLIDQKFVLSVVNVNNKVEAHNLNKIFDRFYQSDEKSEGMGVGLALVKELISLCNGNIIANNLQDGKIQFTITIPLIIEEHNEIYTNSIDTVYNPDQFDGTRKLTPSVLIVEDNVEIRNFLRTQLQTDYNVLEADNGMVGFEIASKKMPDLIISDVMMPIMDGKDFCKKIKSQTTTSTIPVILLTALSGSKNEVVGLEHGADAYITKPFNPEKLKLVIANILSSTSKIKNQYKKMFTENTGLETYKLEEKFLQDLKSVLDKHITDPNFTADKFCQLMGMSRTQLHRKLKTIAGFSTTEFIRKQRLQLGEILLKESDATISEIAYQLGFNSSSYFIKCFKKDYNCTPEEYRNSA